MTVKTTRFGEIDIADEKIIAFRDGLPGFEELKRFALISTEETDPFHWFQAMDDPDVALAVINPFQLFPDYSPMIDDSVFDDLGVASDEDILLLTVAVIPQEFRNMTTNLTAPILINTIKNCGRQVILEVGDYEVRRPIYEPIQEYTMGRGEADAGADAQGGPGDNAG